MKSLLALPAVRDLFSLLGDDQVRLVGGCVRDSILRAPIKDIDACTPIEPDAVMALGKKSEHFSVHPTGLTHGTVTLFHRASRLGIEVTTLRRDVSTDGRHATVAFTKEWQEDAARRDFTFNALMLGQDGTLHDYFGGQEDLAAGRIRFIGDAHARLDEDWLRALRYFRFWGRFGQAFPDEGERHALKTAATNLNRLSVERIWVELKGLVQTNHAAPALALFKELGFDAALGIKIGDADLKELDPIAAWFALLKAEGIEFLIRMKASTAETSYFSAIANSHASGASVFERQIRFGHKPTCVAEKLKGLKSDLSPPPDFPIKGKDLLHLGMEPGPEIGRILETLLTTWINSNGHLSKADLLEDFTKSKT